MRQNMLDLKRLNIFYQKKGLESNYIKCFSQIEDYFELFTSVISHEQGKHDQINRNCYTNYEKIVKNNTFWANLEQRKSDNTFGIFPKDFTQLFQQNQKNLLILYRDIKYYIRKRNSSLIFRKIELQGFIKSLKSNQIFK